LLALLDVNLRIFPLHLRPHKSGSADSEIQQLCAQIIDQFVSNQSISLTFVSVDGDAGYQSLFDHQFNLLFPLTAPTADLRPILQAMQEFRSRQIGGFLHFFKNAGARIYERTIHSVCSPLDRRISVAELSRIFWATKFLGDFSPIGRMRDIYPRSLFTIQNPLFVSTRNEPDAFQYLLTYANWEESLVNQALSKSMRLFMLQVVFHFMYELCYAIEKLKLQMPVPPLKY
jgi:hypothetical protein